MIIKRTPTFFFLLATLFCKSALSQVYKQFVNKDFSISYPESWQLDSSKRFVSAIMFYSPIEGPEDKFRENVNVMLQDLRGRNINLDEYKKITDDQISAMGEKAGMIRSVVEKTANGSQYSTEYQMTVNGVEVHVKQVCVIKEEVAYLATFTAKPDTFDRYLPIGTAMLQSFKVK